MNVVGASLLLTTCWPAALGKSIFSVCFDRFLLIIEFNVAGILFCSSSASLLGIRVHLVSAAIAAANRNEKSNSTLVFDILSNN